MRALLLLLLVGAVVMGTHLDASAFLGNGVCDATEQANQQCTVFGGLYTVEIVPGGPSGNEFPISFTCNTSGGPVACSAYPYRLSGTTLSGDNNIAAQVLAGLIPPAFLSPQNVSGCQQFYTNWTGTPDGFGKNDASNDICRIAQNPNPPPNLPPNANLFIFTLPSNATPKAIQLKAGKFFYGGTILLPGEPIADLATSEEAVTTAKGATLKVKLNRKGAVVEATGNVGSPAQVIATTDLIICYPDASGDPSPVQGPPGYWCDNILNAAGTCRITTVHEDPIYFSTGGTAGTCCK